MVPEDPSEGAALSAPVPADEGNPEAEAEAAESAEVAVGGSTGLSWADISEGATAPTTGLTGVGGAASSALGEEEDFDILKFGREHVQVLIPVAAVGIILMFPLT